MQSQISRKSLIVGGIAGLAASFMGAGAALAEPLTLEEAQKEIEQRLPGLLTDRAAELGLPITFDDFSFALTPELWGQYGGDTTALLSDVVAEYFGEGVEPKESAGPPVMVPFGTSVYKARVWSGIPALGHGYVNQEVRATVTSGKITSASNVGPSWMSGAQIGTWSPAYTTLTRTKSNTRLKVQIKGQIYYVWKGVTLGGRQTFLTGFKVSGGKLVKTLYNDL